MPVDRPRVLVVDDSEAVADLYVQKLSDRYDATAVYGGEPALDVIEDDYDVVLVDRYMSDLSGDDVVRRIREGDIDTAVIVVTAVEPDLSLVDLPVDDYLCKPVSREDLIAAVETQLQVSDETFREYLATLAKIQLIKHELSVLARRDDTVTDLERQVEELEPELAASVPDFEAIVDRFTTIDRTP